MTEIDRNIIKFETERVKILRGQLVPFSEIKPCLDANYLLAGWLGDRGLSVLYGPSNCGKTFVAVDIAMHVASGVPWRGSKVKPGPVVYVAAEGGAGIRNRVSAIRKAKPELSGSPDFTLLPTHLDLHGTEDAMALCAALPTDWAALIVVDTLARSIGTGDENSSRDVGQFVANLDAIRERTGAHVLVVHHSGKDTDRGARGSSALRAAVDTEVAITDRQITCVKQRDMEMPHRLFFDLKTVHLGDDVDGDPVSSAVVVPADGPAKQPQTLKGRDEVAAAALSEALRLHGRERSGESFPLGRKVVELAKWKDQCKANGLTNPEASADAQRKAFDRAKERLMDRDIIRVWGDFVWMVSDDD